MQIHVRVNEEGALRNQRFAFTNRFTLVCELLQNARRARATHARIEYEEATRRLRISDDGHGVKDFQALLTLHESGWDSDTQGEERPFGVGFSKCLYASSRCIVRSGDRFIDFRTAEALQKNAIDVHLDSRGAIQGTEVELHDVDLSGLDDRIGRLCEGFAIDVTYNGRLIDRPYARDHIEAIATPIGALHLAGTRSGNFSTRTLVFLQGLRVSGPMEYSPGHVNIVHLDSRMFRARLPDRDCLIDVDDHLPCIHTEIRQQWRIVLEGTKRTLPASTWVERYFRAMGAFGHRDLLNDVDDLPRHVCSAIVDYPIQQDEYQAPFLDPDIAPPLRQRIESGETILVDLDPVDATSAATWMYAFAHRYLVINPYELHEGHWCHTQVRRLDAAQIHLEAVGVQTRALFDGRWIRVTVVLCASVRLCLGDDAVDIADDGVFHDDVLYIPAGETTGKAVRQASDYTDHMDRFLHDDLHADLAALADLIRQLRSTDPSTTLDSLLAPLHLQKYPVLRGKTFRLTVAGDSDTCTIDLIE